MQFMLCAFEFLESQGSIALSDGLGPLVSMVRDVLSKAEPPSDGPSWIRARDRAELVIGLLRLCDERASAGAAFRLVNGAVEVVEDHFSRLSRDEDGRMGGPEERFRVKRDASMSSRVAMYRHRLHATLIGENGALEIRALVNGEWMTAFCKPGADWKTVDDLLGEGANR